MSRVDINDDNIRHCRCPQCPVQGESKCAKEGLEKFNNGTKAADFSAEEAPMLYCATGKSFCSDLDANHGCLCPSCLVWDNYDMQSTHYCLKGNADEIN
jgi:hypothetical protein